MAKDIIVKKGLNINLVGDATKTLDISKNSKYYSVYPEDFHGVFPKLTIKADEKVKAGDVLFYDKNNEEVKFVSPVSGKITEIQRGERRRIVSIEILADKKLEYKFATPSSPHPFKISISAFISVLLSKFIWDVIVPFILLSLKYIFKQHTPIAKKIIEKI